VSELRRLRRFLRTRQGRRALYGIFVFAVLSLTVYLLYTFLKPAPAYTRSPGLIATTVCNTGGRDCDGIGSVRLWTDTTRAESNFVRSPRAPACVATKSETTNGEDFWWIDCGLSRGRELPVIEGWVPARNLKFTGEVFP
jgi:hypothetical protein